LGRTARKKLWGKKRAYFLLSEVEPILYIPGKSKEKRLLNLPTPIEKKKRFLEEKEEYLGAQLTFVWWLGEQNSGIQ